MQPEVTGNVIVVKANCFAHLYTTIRDKNTHPVAWRKAALRVMNILCEEAISYAHPQPLNITTPTNAQFAGTVCDPNEMVGISIIRAGDSMLGTFMEIAPEATVGKILIQRNEETREPVLYYSKVPPLEGKQIMLLDPMVATGGSAICAIKVLLDKGALESNITFVNVLACPEGIAAMTKAYPSMRIVTGKIDDGLNEKAYIMPGLGDFGDRFFGTN